MDANVYNKPFLPITTGAPAIGPARARRTGEGTAKQNTVPFQELLREKLAKQSDVSFSKHAVTRAVERGLDLDGISLERLNEGVRIAEQKGLDDTLILVDRTAFIVSVKNNTVITAVSGEDLKGNVFTNIQGTVII